MGASPARLLAQNGAMQGCVIGDLSFVDRPLRFGEHGGNRFTVLIRHLDPACTDSMLAAAVRRVQVRGFINYFGHQRFGNSAASMMPSIEVGRLLCLKDWDRALAAAMRVPSHSCNPDERRAKQRFDSADPCRTAPEALSLLPKYCHDERMLLQALAEVPPAPSFPCYTVPGGLVQRPARQPSSPTRPLTCSDTSVCQGAGSREALQAMPHGRILRQAYWSCVWNKMASARIALYGAAHPAALARRAPALRAPRARSDKRARMHTGLDSAVEGDLVLASAEARGAGEEARGPAAAGEDAEDAAWGQRKIRLGEQVVTSHLSNFAQRNGSAAWRFGDAGAGAQAPEVHVVTAAEAAEGRYGIHHVVLPVLDGASPQTAGATVALAIDVAVAALRRHAAV